MFAARLQRQRRGTARRRQRRIPRSPRVGGYSGREDLELVDLRTDRDAGSRRAGRRSRCSARPRPLLDWHQRHRFCAQCGQPTKATAGGWRRECGSLQGAAFPAHRPRRHHARRRRRALPAGPATALSQRHVFRSRRLRRAGRDDRGGGKARDNGGIRRRSLVASAMSPRSPGLFRLR